MKGFVLSALLFLWFSSSGAQSYFTFVDDDAASLDAINQMDSLAQTRGVHFCFAVVAEKVLKNKQIYQRLLEFQEYGHQICNHSLTHSKEVWSGCSAENLGREIERSHQILDSLGFRNVDYFVYPFGKFSEEQFSIIYPLVSKHNKLAFNARGRFNGKKSNAFYLDRLALRKFNDLSMVKQVIDQAADANGWIVFLTHSNNSRDFDAEYVGEVMDYCLAKGMISCTLNEYTEWHGNEFIKTNQISEFTWYDEVQDVLYMNLIKLLWCISSILAISIACVVIRKKHCWDEKDN